MDGYGILKSYIIQARKDGSDKHALVFGLITELVQNNIEIKALLEGDSCQDITTSLRVEADKFVEHARTYIVRFKVIPSIVVTGEKLPSWQVFPIGFPAALESQIAVRNRSLHPVQTIRSRQIILL